jgi:hypothetical protein
LTTGVGYQKVKTATTLEEIKQALRDGYCFCPTMPGLQEAARDLIRPIIESMRGREIIYVCRFYWMMRVDSLKVDDDGFRAHGTPTHDLDNRFPPWDDQPREPEPLNFSAPWRFLRMCGSAIHTNMVTDHFFTDQSVVAEVKAAVVRGETREIPAILDRAMRQKC